MVAEIRSRKAATLLNAPEVLVAGSRPEPSHSASMGTTLEVAADELPNKGHDELLLPSFSNPNP